MHFELFKTTKNFLRNLLNLLNAYASKVWILILRPLWNGRRTRVIYFCYLIKGMIDKWPKNSRHFLANSSANTPSTKTHLANRVFFKRPIFKRCWFAPSVRQNCKETWTILRVLNDIHNIHDYYHGAKKEEKEIRAAKKGAFFRTKCLGRWPCSAYIRVYLQGKFRLNSNLGDLKIKFKARSLEVSKIH